MAGGIDWFRWHHGSVNDPKFQLVAKKAAASVAEVIAVWACLLEAASASDDRGNPGDPDFEAIDCAMGLEDGQSEAIYQHMRQRGLIAEDGRIASWEKRQPKREDETAAERKRRQREREMAVTDGESRDVTQGHADVTRCHDRGEESREEKVSDASHPRRQQSADDLAPKLPACPFDEVVALYHEALPEWPRVRLMERDRKTAIGRMWRWALTSKRSDGSVRATTKDQALTWFKGYFTRARDNDFLMGRVPGGEAHRNWRPDLDFLMTTKGLKQVIEKTQEAA